MSVVWIRLKDSALQKVEARKVSFSTPDSMLELYLEAFGEIKQVKKQRVIWKQTKDEDHGEQENLDDSNTRNNTTSKESAGRSFVLTSEPLLQCHIIRPFS